MSKPNVIFILIDDLGWNDLSFTGSSFYETPNIDRLAAAGMNFTNAYATCPVCSPTRASILSGRYPARLGLTNFIGRDGHWEQGSEKGKLLSAPYIPYLPTTEYSIAKAFRENGYQTWHVGKWHVGEGKYCPENHGFDVNIGSYKMQHGYFAPWNTPYLPSKSSDDYLTDRLGDEAEKLIMESGGTPFFMHMCFYQVHIPLMAKTDRIAKYEQKAKSMGLDKVRAIVKGGHFSSERLKDKHIMRRIIQSDPVYAAMIEHLDDNIGKILDAVDRKGIAENTIIVFTSDNGGLSTAEGSPTCNAPLAEGKGWVYDGGVKVPLAITWPDRITADSNTDAIVCSTDFYPTLLEAAGLQFQPEQHLDGKSFFQALEGKTGIDRGPIFWHYPHYSNQGSEPACSIRKGDWKLIEFFDGPVELYNLAEDVGENNDLASKYPEIVSELLAELHKWQDEMHAVKPEPNPDWKPWREASLKSID